MTLPKKDPHKSGHINKFRPVTLLNANFKALAKMLTKSLAFVVVELLGNAQTCIISSRSTHDNIHSMQYIIDRVGK